jgi:ABC-2 type transport system permease protein
VLFYLCRDFFTDLPHGLPDGPRLAAYAASLVLAFFIGFFLEASLGMLGFWILEVSSLLYVINTLNFFVSGHMFPLDLLPGFWPDALRLLPFQYLAYFPAMVFLGKTQGTELAWGLGLELAWAVFFAVLARLLYRRGLRRYSAYGG